MKRIISLIIASLVLAASLTSAVFADDAVENPVYLDGDFSSDIAASQHFYPGNFKSDGNYLTGYSDALAFQSVGAWSSYDVVFEAMFAEDDVAAPGATRSLSFIYINPNMKHNGLREDNYNMSIVFEVTKDKIALVGNSFFNDGTGDSLVEAVDFDFEDNTDYSFGISVSEGQIRVFVNGELLIDFVDEENKYFIGYAYEEVEPSIMLWWNSGGCTAFKDVNVSAPGHFLPFPKPITYGDATGDGKINLGDVSLMLKHIAKWENLEIDLAAADVTADEKLNLADVSRLLKRIAKWEYIVLGPHEKHSFSDWKLTTKPTLSEEGSKSRTCTECGETETEVIPVLTLDDVFKTYPDFVMRLGTFDSAEDLSDDTLFEWATSNGSGAYIESIVDDVNFIYTHKYDAAILNSFIEKNLGVTIDYNKLVENNGSYYNTEFVYDEEAGIITVIYHGGFGYGYPEPIYNGYEKLDDSTYAVKFADYDSVEYVITLKETDNGFLILSFKRV